MAVRIQVWVVLIENAEGLIVGAIGLSGDESYNDEAIAGVKAAGLFPAC